MKSKLLDYLEKNIYNHDNNYIAKSAQNELVLLGTLANMKDEMLNRIRDNLPKYTTDELNGLFSKKQVWYVLIMLGDYSILKTKSLEIEDLSNLLKYAHRRKKLGYESSTNELFNIIKNIVSTKENKEKYELLKILKKYKTIFTIADINNETEIEGIIK